MLIRADMKLLLLLLAIVSLAHAERHAVIVGSVNNPPNLQGFDNACTYIDSAIRAGVPASNIILVTFGKFPDNLSTMPAKLLRCMSSISYHMDELDPRVIHAILRGHLSEAQSLMGVSDVPVLESKPEDLVIFIYSNPKGEKKKETTTGDLCMKKSDLKDTFNWMFEHKKFQKLLLMLECSNSKELYKDFEKSMVKWHATAVVASSIAQHLDVQVYPHPHVSAKGSSDDDEEESPHMKHSNKMHDQLFSHHVFSFLQADPDKEVDIGKLIEQIIHDFSILRDHMIQTSGDDRVRDIKLSSIMGSKHGSIIAPEQLRVQSSVSMSDLPYHSTLWRASRCANPDDTARELEALDDIRMTTAMRDIEAMRLAKMFMDDSNVNKLMFESPSGANTSEIHDCLVGLTVQLITHCHHELPLTEVTNNIVFGLCSRRITVSSVDWSEVCIPIS